MIENLKSGTWICETSVIDEPGWGKRNAYLAMYHMSHRYVHNKYELDVDYGGYINVDSGQVGMFLGSDFEQGDVLGDSYDDICTTTSESICGGGPVRNAEGRTLGFATSSGFGDGGYDMFMKLDDLTGEVLAVEVIFLPNPKDPRLALDNLDNEEDNSDHDEDENTDEYL
jgi:hypothetical protein